jgi:predicted AAA+ superfamily ATPase
MDTWDVVRRRYRPRVIDGPLGEALQAAPAVLVEGPRACGKTMTGLNAANSYVFLDTPQAQAAREIAPQSLLDGAQPRLLDEWQLAPELWNLVRRAADTGGRPGRFILSGSAVPSDDITRHTGAGRFLRLRLRTMAWYERTAPGKAGTVSLAELFAGARPAPGHDAIGLDDVVTRLLTSGFPALTDLAWTEASAMLRAYIDDVARSDLPRLAAFKRDPAVIEHLIGALARSPGAEVSFARLAADLQSVAPGINAETIAGYVRLLERLFVVETLSPWTPRLRSRARLLRKGKCYLADPALTVAAMGGNAAALLADPAVAGMVFEAAAVHDLTVLAAPLGARTHYYRDSNGHEIDVVLTLPDGRWGAVEVKLGGLAVAKAARSLGAAVEQIDPATLGSPSFALVLTGTGTVATIDARTITCPLHLLVP